jgi:serine kinase of HPr protein (carbohydrate metabolism regulator)
VGATERQIVAGTTIARMGRAVLIRGAPGSGKSDLALRALTMPLQLPGETSAITFDLVSDDQTVIERCGGRIIARAPETIAGRMEIRGIGILDFPAISGADLVLVADARAVMPERLPEAADMRTQLLDVPLMRVDISAIEASAVAKLALALKRYILNASDV